MKVSDLKEIIAISTIVGLPVISLVALYYILKQFLAFFGK